MEPLEQNFRQTRMMGQWLLRMNDRPAAAAAIASLPHALRALADVRQTIWGAEVRTENEAAVLWL